MNETVKAAIVQVINEKAVARDRANANAEASRQTSARWEATGLMLHEQIQELEDFLKSTKAQT